VRACSSLLAAAVREAAGGPQMPVPVAATAFVTLQLNGQAAWSASVTAGTDELQEAYRALLQQALQQLQVGPAD
jgi:hypothetical protein